MSSLDRVGKYDDIMPAGATYTLQIEWKDGDGTPQDLTSYTAQYMARRKPEDASPALSVSEVSNGQGVIALGGAAGTVTVTINDATTATLSGWYVYDIVLTSGAGVKTRILEGSLKVTPAVTR